MLQMNLIRQEELCAGLYMELDRELYGDLYWKLHWGLNVELRWELGEELGLQIRTNFLHSKISRV
jgi:hypothetical protein